MPTIFRKNGFRFFIPVLDHAPAHVHVAKDGGEAKFNLNPVELVKSDGLKMKDVNEAYDIIVEQKDAFEKQWKAFHPDL